MYTLDDIPLGTEPLQQNLGVVILIFPKTLCSFHNCNKKANQRIGLVKRCFSGLNIDKIDRLFKGIIRPFF